MERVIVVWILTGWVAGSLTLGAVWCWLCRKPRPRTGVLEDFRDMPNPDDWFQVREETLQ